MFSRLLAPAVLISALAIPGTAFGQVADPQPAQPMGDDHLMAVLHETGEHQTLIQVLEASGLAAPLAADGPFTLFAPTDEAFESLPEGTLEALMQDPETLQSVLALHVVQGEVRAEELTAMDTVESAFGYPIAVTASGGSVQVAGVTVTGADHEASNGIVHIVEGVLQPTDD